MRNDWLQNIPSERQPCFLNHLELINQLVEEYELVHKHTFDSFIQKVGITGGIVYILDIIVRVVTVMFGGD